MDASASPSSRPGPANVGFTRRLCLASAAASAAFTVFAIIIIQISQPIVWSERREPAARSARPAVASVEGAVWLMTFPNSGTTYTSLAVQLSTNTKVATNYGYERGPPRWVRDTTSVPVFADSPDGPYFLAGGETMDLPRVILTKTHCAGFSQSPHPEEYIETPRSFLTGCLRAIKFEKSARKNLTNVWYSKKLVQKALHIVRNPLDNIVARFHYEKKKANRGAGTAVAKSMSNDSFNEGFKSWCESQDSKSKDLLAQSRWADRDVVRALAGVPCHADFIRFVQWHNLAFNTVSDLGIPSMTFHYEDYATDHARTLERILSFLELEKRNGAPPFVATRTYRSYYTKENKLAIGGLVKAMATAPTLRLLERYYDGDSIV